MSGKRFGRLVVTAKIGRRAESLYWLCLCDCGKKTSVRGTSLRSGATRSCGCSNPRHKTQNRRAYQGWRAIIRRCYDPGMKPYKYYGERGITVCNRWRVGEDGQSGFDCFIEDMGLRPEGFSLDRIDNDGQYSPDNCRWANAKQQAQNRRLTRDAKGQYATVS